MAKDIDIFKGIVEHFGYKKAEEWDWVLVYKKGSFEIRLDKHEGHFRCMGINHDRFSDLFHVNRPDELFTKLQEYDQIQRQKEINDLLDRIMKPIIDPINRLVNKIFNKLYHGRN